MQIANPIYDVVFKYLMEDSKSAKILISSLIQEEIITIDFLPQEVVSYRDYYAKYGKPELFYTVRRLDFKAKIKTGTGFKTVLIEIQKAKYASDIMRFRRYLGENYIDPENSYIDKSGNKEISKALPIICIYFLGHNLDRIKNPVIKAVPQYTDLITGEKIDGHEDFIDSLTHSSIVVQIPQLKERRQSELEKLLSIFDQGAASNYRHILNIRDDEFPPKYGEVIRRLQRAMAEPEMRKRMDLEDDIFRELEENEREIAQRDEEIKMNKRVIEEKEKTIEEKDKTIQEKEKNIEEKEKTIEELWKELEELRKNTESKS